MDACARGLACPERGVLTLVGPLTCLTLARGLWGKCGSVTRLVAEGAPMLALCLTWKRTLGMIWA